MAINKQGFISAIKQGIAPNSITPPAGFAPQPIDRSDPRYSALTLTKQITRPGNSPTWSNSYNKYKRPGLMKGLIKAKETSLIKSYKKGGKVNKTGLAFLHKGEKVLTTKQVKKK